MSRHYDESTLGDLWVVTYYLELPWLPLCIDRFGVYSEGLINTYGTPEDKQQLVIFTILFYDTFWEFLHKIHWIIEHILC